ncbi:MAG: 2-C-methyl-D-erythritol 2,4-cyclodiphosphate synthase [Phycisphaerales bacterium]|nr:MAG: 2-C-methyl-D-erythritol 2,4-cyclodiphosphate synthase [Phycisphaerales bacterium]
MDGWRVGIGYDIHRLVEHRRLVLGGVEVPFDKGLLGHSDADVVLHALGDALLGAAGLPDIGDIFPDTDPTYKDADSRRLLGEIMAKVRAKGLVINNVDVIVHAETPKLTGIKRTIAESIASLTGVAVERVSVKAKTNEGVGPLGHAQAIACTAIVSLVAAVGGHPSGGVASDNA